MGSPKHEPLAISSAQFTPHTAFTDASKLSDKSEKTDTDTSITSVITCSPATPAPPSKARAFCNHMMADVEPSLMVELELILLTFCTGIQDAASFPDYQCFTSNQTGNTVFLVLALVMPELNGDIFITSNIGAALGFFLAGSFLTGQLGHLIRPRRRAWLVFCNFFQACMVFAAAAIQQKYDIDLQGARTLVVIGLLAFAAGSQIVQSRAMQMTEISTAMATAAWMDIMVNDRVFILKNNRPQCRRIGFLISLIVGALVGAAIYRLASSAVALYVSAAGKLLVTLLYLFNSSEKPNVERSKV